jgi:hypothetical protein
VRFRKAHFIPISALKGNLPVANMKESAAAQALRVAPLDPHTLSHLASPLNALAPSRAAIPSSRPACGGCDRFERKRIGSLRSDKQIVTKLPLTKLWDEQGTLPGERIRHLDQKVIRELLRMAPARFVVADAGTKLRWIPLEERFEFWKTVGSQIADPLRPIRLEQFPGETAYTASEWPGRAAECLILLEKHH